MARLVSSISRFLTPEQAMSAAAGADVEVLDSRRLGGAWTLDRVWERHGISPSRPLCTPIIPSVDLECW